MDMMGKDINKQFDHYLLIIPRSVNKHIIHRRNDQSHQSIISNYYTQFIGPFPPYSKQTMAKKQKEVEVTLSKKDQKKVDKLAAQIPYHEGRGNLEEITKIKDQIDTIWQKAKEAAYQ
mmetsp:Transcript_22666/g.45889  ORF Transcript_22666/g.45889 Transcript_22666/m.45889 type:complete len:118 (+) Transcript_22666:156-509(+)